MFQIDNPTSSRIPATVEDCVSKIIPATELPRESKPLPYIKKLSHSNGAVVILYGGPHFISPEDPNFSGICDQADKIRPTIVLVENAPDFHGTVDESHRRNKLTEFNQLSREEAVRLGEPSLGLKLASDHSALAEWAAPLLSEQYAHLRTQGYDDIRIFTHYVFRAISMYHNFSDRFSLTEFINWRIEQLKDQIPWEDSKLNWKDAEDFGFSLWKVSLLDEPHKYAKRVNPNELPDEPHYSVINEAACSLNHFINKYLFERITQLSTPNSRLFVLFGASHIYQILPACHSYFVSNNVISNT